jgi:hypothetical protein
MVHDRKDGVFSFAHGEPRDKVHRYLLKGEGVSGRWDTVCGGARLMGNDFILLADRAPFYVVGYPCIHSLPLTVLLYPSHCFIPSRVASCGVVVGPCHYRLSFLCRWGCVHFYCVNEFVVWEYRDALIVVLALVCSWGVR